MCHVRISTVLNKVRRRCRWIQAWQPSPQLILAFDGNIFVLVCYVVTTTHTGCPRWHMPLYHQAKPLKNARQNTGWRWQQENSLTKLCQQEFDIWTQKPDRSRSTSWYQLCACLVVAQRKCNMQYSVRWRHKPLTCWRRLPWYLGLQALEHLVHFFGSHQAQHPVKEEWSYHRQVLHHLTC